MNVNIVWITLDILSCPTVMRLRSSKAEYPFLPLLTRDELIPFRIRASTRARTPELSLSGDGNMFGWLCVAVEVTYSGCWMENAVSWWRAGCCVVFPNCKFWDLSATFPRPPRRKYFRDSHRRFRRKWSGDRVPEMWVAWFLCQCAIDRLLLSHGPRSSL